MENNQVSVANEGKLVNFSTEGKEKIANNDHGLKETEHKNGQDVVTLSNKHLVEGTNPPAPPRSKPLLYYWTSRGESKLRWTPELHDCFFEAVKQLGGPFSATPQDILMKMDIDGLTFEDIRSHFLKYISITELRKVTSEAIKESSVAAEALLGHSGHSSRDTENCEMKTQMDKALIKVSELCQLVEDLSRLEEQPAGIKIENSAGNGDV